MDRTIERALDVRGSFTSIGLLKASSAFQKLKPGESLVILSDDQMLHQDIFRILDPRRIERTFCEQDEGFYRLTITKHTEQPMD
jgi:TusA-related sulfurtransferase